MGMFIDIGRKLLDDLRKKTMENIDYKTYTIKQLDEDISKAVDVIFIDGWDKKENLKYLADEDVAEYEKHYSDDCLDNYKNIRLAMKLFRISENWKPFLDYVMPTEEKQMDYFIHNNPPIQLIIMSLNNRALVRWKEEKENIKNILYDIQKKDAEKLVSSMKLMQESKEQVESGDSKFNDLMKSVEGQLKKVVHRKIYKKQDTSEYFIVRNQEIVDKNYRHRNHRPVTKTYEIIAKDYPELSPAGVKKIIFSHDAPTPTEIKNKTKQ